MAGSNLLEVVGLNKSYSVPVLSDFCFDLLRGEVHALIGSNGAGKSTFARILSGLTVADSGEIRLENKAHHPLSKTEAETAGVVMVLQELNIIRTLSVAENIFLNRLPRRAGFVRYAELHDLARQALARVGLDGLDPAINAGELGVGQQQLVEIAGALARNCRLLILDEPTAALTGPEIEILFENVRRLKAAGVGIIYISHRMDEIRRIADRVTVLRDGRGISTHAAAETTPSELVRQMVGHDLPERKTPDKQALGPIGLRVRHLRCGERVKDVSFDVRQGEILGIAGLIGSGRTETLRAIFGADKKDHGEVFVGSASAAVEISQPGDALRAGIGMVPEDRKEHGLLLLESIRVHTTLTTLRRHCSPGGWLSARAEVRTARAACDDWQCVVPRLSSLFTSSAEATSKKW